MNPYRFSVFLLLLTVLAFAPKAPAQVSVYGTGAATSFGFSGANYTGGTQMKPRSAGFVTGAFYTLPTRTRFQAGLDARYTFAPGYDGGKAYTGGLRLSYVPSRLPVRPYAEFGGGIASTQLRQNACNGTCAQTTSQITSGVVQFGAGLDLRVNRLFDIRPIDYQYDTGGAAGVTHAALHSYSAGLVFHFGRPIVSRP